MKQFKLSIACLAMFAMIFTSCSKEETGAERNPEKSTLSFGAIVQNLLNDRAANKQTVGEIPECSDDVPAYVSLVLSRDGSDVVGSDDDPFEIHLVEGQIFTEEVEELQLDPGIYSLEHFAVYNEDDEVIWIAPRVGSDLGGWINNPLPLSIDLRAGVKKYVEVPVLCFDNRDVNEYGYLFFELVPTEAVEFCFFANYCPPNGGDRHYTANYSVSIWSGTSASGAPLYSSVENSTGQYDNGDYYAEPLCFALPTNDDMDEEYLYYEVTLLDWTGNYGAVAPNTVISGTLSMNDIVNNFIGNDNVDYEHLRFGCEANLPIQNLTFSEITNKETSGLIGGSAAGFIGNEFDNSLYVAFTRLETPRGEVVLKYSNGTWTENFFATNEPVTKRLAIRDNKLIVLGANYVNIYSLEISGGPSQSILHNLNALTRQSVASQGDLLYVTGNSHPMWEEPTIIRSYNYRTNSSSHISTLPKARMHAGSEIVNNKLYIFGGQPGFSVGEYDAESFIVDLGNGSISSFMMTDAPIDSYTAKYRNNIYVGYNYLDGNVRKIKFGVYNTLTGTYTDINHNLTNENNYEIAGMTVLNNFLYVIYTPLSGGNFSIHRAALL